MNIHEYQAKQLFQAFGIAVPQGAVADSPEQAAAVAAGLGLATNNWVVKAQIHAGARGKAGGVKLATRTEQVKAFASEMLGTRLVTIQTGAEGLPVNSVLVEQTFSITREFYLSLLVDRNCERVTFIACAAGGMNIEEIAATHPEQIVTVIVHPAVGLQAYHCRQVASVFGLNKPQAAELSQIMDGMYRLFIEKDASQIEINPLIETTDGQIIALDAKINFDDNAIARHPDIWALHDASQEDDKENKAKQFDLSYITLDGNIGCMVNGAGLAMATMDLVKLKGGKPANFLDVGGGTNQEKVAEAFKLLLSDDNVKAVLVNIFGGIVRCDVIAEGILAAVKEVHLSLPVVVRLEGTNAEQGIALLNDSGLGLVAAEDLNSAAEKVVALVGVAA